MRKKLEGNGMWESSRMMLPEHRERIMEHQSELKLKERPILDEQKLEDISKAIADSLQNEIEITVVEFDEYKDRELNGRVLQVDQRLRRIKLSNPTFGSFYIRFSDIIDVK